MRVAIEISLEQFNLSWFDGTDEFGGPPDFPKAVAISMANVADECSTHDKEFSKQLFPPVSVRRVISTSVCSSTTGAMQLKLLTDSHP